MKFIKAETNGNDFIILEKLENIEKTVIQKMSDRKKGIGADQIILFERIEKVYKVMFFNSDGSNAEMCGNGLCALSKYIGKPEILYLIGDKEYVGYVDQKSGEVSIEAPIPKEISMAPNYKIIDTGNKHIVCLQKHNEILDNTNEFNIHFINILEENSIQIETYERGVGKTLACGSGAIAAAFAYGNHKQKIYIHHEGGDSFVSFEKNSAILSTYPNIVFEGTYKGF